MIEYTKTLALYSTSDTSVEIDCKDLFDTSELMNTEWMRICMITSFDHVAITVKDLDRTINWYVENLGFTVTRTIDNPERGIRIVFLEVASHAMLEFFGFLDSEKAVEGRALKTEETGIKHLSFFVNDLEAVYHQLTKAGVKFTTKTSSRMVFKDLNGIILELRQEKN